jgi:Putative Zn-dependent protease, contains TPR repeats
MINYMVRLFLFLSAISVMLTWSIDGASQNNTFKGKVDPRIDSALTMMHEGDRKTATVIIDEMLDEDSLNVYALVLLAQMDNEFDQNYSAALLTLKHAYAIDTNNLLVVKALSQQLLNMDRGKEAMRILENCEISKWDSDMIILMAMAVNSDSSLRTNKSAEHLLATAIRDSEENRLELIQPLASM